MRAEGVAVRTTALACGHWLVRGDDEEIPPGAACACGEPVHALVTWPLDDDGNRIFFASPTLAKRLAPDGDA